MKRAYRPRQRGAQVPLSNEQKGYLSRLAKEAYQRLLHVGALDPDEENETAFRQRETLEVCGRRISEALNGDFEDIEARFLMLKGDTKRAFASAMKGDTNEERQARWKLALLCQKLKIETPTLEGASVKRIWAVYFNIKQNPKYHAAGVTRDLQAELARAVKEERYEDAAKLKREIEAH